MLEQLLRQRLHVGSRVAGEQDHLEQLVIRQIFGAGRDQPLAQPFAVTVIVRPVIECLGQAQPSGAVWLHRPGQLVDRRRAASWASMAPAIRAGSSVSYALTKQSMPRCTAAEIGNS